MLEPSLIGTSETFPLGCSQTSAGFTESCSPLSLPPPPEPLSLPPPSDSGPPNLGTSRPRRLFRKCQWKCSSQALPKRSLPAESDARMQMME